MSATSRLYPMRFEPAQADTVGIEMNILLRNLNLSLNSAEAFNIIYRAIFNEDHESMERRRSTASR